LDPVSHQKRAKLTLRPYGSSGAATGNLAALENYFSQPFSR
jgi:glutamine synthetase adenylyltransferase